MTASTTHESRSLSAELEAAAVRALRRAYQHYSETFFAGLLRPAVLTLSDGGSRLGCWSPVTRTIEVSRSLLLREPWGVVVEVLKHEMAHQFVDEVLGRRGEAAHGPAFREVCQERGIDPGAAGLPRGGSALGAEGAGVLGRIVKLLALAESANEHEAQAAMSAAQRLMLKHNLTDAQALRPSGYGFRHLGEPTGRVYEPARVLARILSDHFFVEAIWVSVWRPSEGTRGTVLEVCGTSENLELAEYVHSFLTHTSERLWREHKRARRIDRNRDRRAYTAGVMTGFLERLDSQRQVHEQQGLVWLGDPNLGSFFKQRHPHVRWTTYASTRRSEAHEEGRAAGRNIVLHRGVSAGPGADTKLLGGRS